MLSELNEMFNFVNFFSFNFLIGKIGVRLIFRLVRYLKADINVQFSDRPVVSMIHCYILNHDFTDEYDRYQQ
jgi:hypothetical protein